MIAKCRNTLLVAVALVIALPYVTNLVTPYAPLLVVLMVVVVALTVVWRR